MSFLHLWAIGIGSAALAAPIVVHLMTKPKPQPYSLSTFRFLAEVIQQRKARSRLRDILVLLLRMLCIGLLASALARPLFSDRPKVSTETARNAQRVIVIDNSFSMLVESGGVSCWSAAVASGLQYLESAPSMQAGVVFAGAKPRAVFQQLSANLPGLRSAIQQTRPVAERCDARAAMEEAAKLLQQSTGTKNELVIISDFQRANWGTLPLEMIPQGTEIQFHSVALPNTSNLFISEVHIASQPIVNQPVNVEIEITNYSALESKVKCELSVGGLIRTIETSVAPETTRSLSERFTFPEAGWKYGWARLLNNADMLPEDDERPIAVQIRPPVHIQLLSRQTIREIPSSSFYIEQALNVALQASHTEATRPVVARLHPDRDSLRNGPVADVIVLDHPGSLAQETLQEIVAQIKRGHGLLYVVSEFVDANNLVQLADVLGSDFQPPVHLHPYLESQPRKDLSIRKTQSLSVPFEELGNISAANMLKPVRISGGLASQLNPAGLADDVVAELSDTSALIYLTSVGAGHIAVINADLGKSNWATQPTFLPVLSELVKSLLSGRSSSESANPGEPMVRLLPANLDSQSTLSARTIDGIPPMDNEFGNWLWNRDQGSFVWSWSEPTGPGIYALEESAVPVWMIATAAPASESDLSALEKAVLTQRVSEGYQVGYSSNSDDQRPQDDIWKWLIVACLLGLVAEILLLRWNRM